MKNTDVAATATTISTLTQRACAASGRMGATPPTRVMNSRRLIVSPQGQDNASYQLNRVPLKGICLQAFARMLLRLDDFLRRLNLIGSDRKRASSGCLRGALRAPAHFVDVIAGA